MRAVKVKLTNDEFKVLDDICKIRGISKQSYCKKRILEEEIVETDFKSIINIDDKKPDFYFYVQFKLSAKERDLVDEIKGDMTLQEFCKRAVLNKEIINIEDLKHMKYELSKIGNNINQIARIANKSGDIDNKNIDILVEAFLKFKDQLKETDKKIIERFA